jgi:predicted ATPase/DNA-binding SARP family transcriptional activator
MRFGILGPFEVVDDRGRQLAIGGRKPSATLAILIARRGEPVSVERLADELWGERAPATAAKTVQVYISRLRKALGKDLLQTRGQGYVLSLGREQLDADRFDRLASEGRDALVGGDPLTANARLCEALGLWRGEPLTDFCYEPFAQAAIARLEEAHLTAVEDRIDADLALGRHSHLVGELEALVRAQPRRERLRAQLMLALYRSRRHSDALETYRLARHALVEELGIEPGRQLRELHQGILEQHPGLDLATAPPTPVTTQAAGLPPTNLPPRARRLLGRDRELTDLRELLTAHAAPLVTVSGIGGSGKTLLALAVGSELLAWASGGVFLVRLAAIRDRDSVLPMIAEAVGVTDQSEASLPEALARRLGQQPTLLILDNLEQLVDAASLITDLATDAPELRVLVTSQVPLRVRSERVFTLGPLNREDAITLFIERAQARDRRFEPVREERDAVERICALLDDTPLAIELAAARMQSLAPTGLLERLEQPLRLLTRSDRDAPERQRSLRAAIDWTYGLLAPGQKELFAWLGVCAGPMPLSAVEAIAGPDRDPSVLDHLDALIDASLVRRQAQGPPGPRFFMPQALRDYACERLRETDEEQSVRRRHAEHVATVVHAGRFWKWHTTPRERADLEALAQEVRPAVAWARVHDAALHVRLCAAAGLYWIYRGVISEAQDELQTAFDCGEGSPAERAWVTTLLAKCRQLASNDDKAVDLVEQARQAWRQVADERERALGLGDLIWVYRWASPEQALALAEDALSLLRRTGDSALILRGLVFFAQALVEVDELSRAWTVLEEAETLADGEPTWELATIRADLTMLGGDSAAAIRFYVKSLEWTSEIGDSHQTLMNLRALAIALARAGHTEAFVEVHELVRLQQDETGRAGNVAALAAMLGGAMSDAREVVEPTLVEAAVKRARAIPPPQRTNRAIELGTAMASPASSLP